MKISLLSSCFSTGERYGKSLGKVGPITEPLGLAYLAASILKKRPNDQVEIIDPAVLGYTKTDLKNHLEKTRPDIIGISILTPLYFNAKEVIKIAKEVLNEPIIIAGGPHVTIFPKATMEENKDINYAVMGEGDITITELLDSIDNKKEPSNVAGLVYREKGQIKFTNNRQFIKNLDEIPLPRRDLLPMHKYRPAPTYYMRLPSYIILTSRGCPFRCSYCSKIFGDTYRHHSSGRVISVS